MIFSVTGDIYNKRKEMGYTYVTTNYLTDEVYVGQSIKKPHENPDYLGSGKRIVEQINKYGKENFYKQIIDENVPEEFLDDLEIMRIAEHREILGPEMVLNIANGGEGGNTLKFCPQEKRDLHRENTRKAVQERMKNPEEREKCNAFKGLSEEERKVRLKVWSECKKRGKNGRAKIVQDLETGQIFDCLRTACDVLGLNINTEKWRRSKGVSRLVDDIDENRKGKRKMKRVNLKTVNCPSCDG